MNAVVAPSMYPQFVILPLYALMFIVAGGILYWAYRLTEEVRRIKEKVDV